MKPSGKGVGPMRPWTLVIIGVALTAATVRAFLAPFPGIGGNPVAEPSGPAELDPQVRKELARIEEAILAGAVPLLEEYGGRGNRAMYSVPWSL